MARALEASFPKDVLEWCDDEDEDCRPQRAGFRDEKKDVVFEEVPEKRDRELDEGVFLPEEEPSVVALLINSCITDEVVDDELVGPAAAAVDPLGIA